MQDFINNQVQPYFNYWCYVIIMMIGLWGAIGKNNLIKKLIGISIFQTAIILFYVSLGVKDGASIPIHDPKTAKPPAVAVADNLTKKVEYDDKGKSDKPYKKKKKYAAVNPDKFVNPLPHVLMLTAIVVGVATLGVALAISQSIFKDFGTLEEDEIIEKIKAGDY